MVFAKMTTDEIRKEVQEVYETAKGLEQVTESPDNAQLLRWARVITHVVDSTAVWWLDKPL